MKWAISLSIFMVLVGVGVYLFPGDNNNGDYSYLKDKRHLNQLAEAFKKVEEKNLLQREPSSSTNETPEENNLGMAEGYQLFLDKNNPYHVLLSRKILNKNATTSENLLHNKEEAQLREYEKTHSLSYEDEIEKILKSGNFDKNVKEEIFLLEELAPLKEEAAINLLEQKLLRIIGNINEDPNVDEWNFKCLLSLYIEKINLRNFNMQSGKIDENIDTSERRKILEDQITSPKLKNILTEYWGQSQGNAEVKADTEVDQGNDSAINTISPEPANDDGPADNVIDAIENGQEDYERSENGEPTPPEFK